jgi:transposase-like protein
VSLSSLNEEDDFGAIPVRRLVPGRVHSALTALTVSKCKRLFLESLRQGSSITRAAEHAGMGSRQTAYDWRSTDHDFSLAWDDAIESGTDRLEDEAYRRAHDGVAKPIVFQGAISREDDIAYRKRLITEGQIEDSDQINLLSGPALDAYGTVIGVERARLFVREHSDMLMSRLLAARREIYRRSSSDVTLSNGGNGSLINQTINIVNLQPVEAARSYQSMIGSDE